MIDAIAPNRTHHSINKACTGGIADILIGN